jgi:hypothetical protein
VSDGIAGTAREAGDGGWAGRHLGRENAISPGDLPIARSRQAEVGSAIGTLLSATSFRHQEVEIKTVRAPGIGKLMRQTGRVICSRK